MNLEQPEVAREVARRLRENDAQGDEAALREMGAKCIELLLVTIDRYEQALLRARATRKR